MTYEEDLSSLLVELKLIFNGCMKEFHDQSKSERPREKYNKNIHADVMKLLRKIASEDGGTRGDYLKLLKHNPKLKDREYLSKYFTMLRLYKSNKFKLDEIDNLEKNIKRFIKSLDSDIM